MPKKRTKKRLLGPRQARLETCAQCGAKFDLNGFGWLVNGAKEPLCSQACFTEKWQPKPLPDWETL